MSAEKIRHAKQELRRTIRGRLKEFPIEEQQAESHAVAEVFIGIPEWRKSEDVFLFLSMSGEIDTAELVQAAISDGKRIWAPRLHGDEMEFHLIWDSESRFTQQSTRSELDLEYNPYGIWEPRESAPVFPTGAEGGIMAVPGLAFDREGGRLGRGKGYYDKWLSRHADLLVHDPISRTGSGWLVPVGIGMVPLLTMLRAWTAMKPPRPKNTAWPNESIPPWPSSRSTR